MQLSFPNIVVAICVAASIALSGCERPRTPAKTVKPAPEKPKYRKYLFAGNCDPHGNDTTLRYFASVNQRHANYLYCSAVLDDNGDCTELHLNICYEPKSIDVEEMLQLPKLQKITLNGETITDEHLATFERMPSLKELGLGGYAEAMTPQDIEQLQKTRPDIKVSFRFKKQPADLLCLQNCPNGIESPRIQPEHK